MPDRQVFSVILLFVTSPSKASTSTMSSQQIHVQLNGSDATIILDDRDPRPSRNSSVVPVLPPNYNDNNSTTSAPTIMPPPPTLAPTGAPEMGYTIWGSPFINESMHTLIVSILIALIVVLSIILIVLLMPLFRRSLRRRAATDKKRIKKRQQTVDAWLITKVRETYIVISSLSRKREVTTVNFYCT